MTFVPIKPRGFSEPQKALVQAELDRLGRRVVSETKQYPPMRPWKNGKGRRTGNLGRSWDFRVSTSVTVTLTISSEGVRYATYVQGSRQTSVMAGRDWKTVMANFDAALPETKRRLAAWAAVKVK